MGSRRCAECGHRVSDDARFCEQCGAALTASAEPLRAPGTLEAKILTERSAIEGERKQVTVMYTDIVGSMRLTHALDAERWGFVLDCFLAMAASAVHAFEGTVNQFTGDGLLAVFGAPVAHEDHARRACLAVLELQREVAGLAGDVARSDGVEFAVRCGLNSGEVVVGAIGDDVHMDFVPIGNTTALGQRIESLAPVGSTAISASTAALVDGEFDVRELGDFEVEGVEGRQRVLELLGLGAARTRLEATASTRGLSRFVGRDRESAELQCALERAMAGDGEAVGIVGDPGVGKSRLVREFAVACAARGLAVNSTGGVAHGRYIPLLPILALYRDLFGIVESDASEIAQALIETTMSDLHPASADDLPLLFEFLGVADPERPPAALDPEGRQQRLVAIAKRVVEARAPLGAAVLVVEDVHWFDFASAAFLEKLVAAIVGTRTLVIVTYRPEHEAAWKGIGPHSQLGLGPLGAAATDDLLTGLVGRDRSLDGLAALIKARAAGNPFFVEEIVQALADNGDLSGARGEYRLAAQVEELVLPATVQAGLAARIDGLPSREKALVQTMSVLGAKIPAPLLSEVSELAPGELAEAVEMLERAQLVTAPESTAGGEYVFKHPLTQEVAYKSQLSPQRGRGHRMAAAAIERTYPGALDERAALLAQHCEACGERLEAAGWHARAAAWAGVTSPPDGMRHWRRVRHLTDQLEDSPEREELAAQGRVGILSQAWRLGISPAETAEIHAEARADTERFRLDLFHSGNLMHSGREREGLEGFRADTRQAVAAGDHTRALLAATGVAYASWIAGSLSEAAETMGRALALAGDDPMAGTGLAFVCPGAHALQSRGLCWGYMGELEAARRDFGHAIELAREHDDPETESASLANLALVEAEVGEIEAALRHAALGLAIAERADNTIHMVACSAPTAVAQAGAGRFADALARAASDLTTIRDLGTGLYFEPLLLATIARSRLALGEPDDALTAAEEAVAIMDARGLATCALPAPLALAHVLIATRGAAAGARIEVVLARAMRVARESRAVAFEQRIQRELAALARLHDDHTPTDREQAEA